MELASRRVAEYFRVKSRQLRASASLPICEHNGLAGSHREELQRIYLTEILPRRFEIGRGMVYGLFDRSHEADIVIWDSHNFPSLPMLDHTFFFAESTRLVLESKSRWSRDDFRDVLRKSKAVRDIVAEPRQTIDDEIAFMQLDIAALKEGVHHQGMLQCSHHIATAAVFLSGGDKVFDNPEDFKESVDAPSIDDEWPDIILLLDVGKVVLKQYEEDDDGSYGRLYFFSLGEDALFLFTSALLQLLTDRSVMADGRFYLERYAFGEIDLTPYGQLDFRLTRIPPGRTPLWQ